MRHIIGGALFILFIIVVLPIIILVSFTLGVVRLLVLGIMYIFSRDKEQFKRDLEKKEEERKKMLGELIQKVKDLEEEERSINSQK